MLRWAAPIAVAVLLFAVLEMAADFERARRMR